MSERPGLHRPTRRRRAREVLWLVIGLSGSIGGCSTQSTLLPASAASQADAPTLVASRGIGIFGTDSGLAIGWLSEMKLYLRSATDDCRVIVVLQDLRLLAALQDWLLAAGSGLERVCVAANGVQP